MWICLEVLGDVNSTAVATAQASLHYITTHVQPYDLWSLFQAVRTNHKHQASLYVVMNVTSATAGTEAGPA